MSDNEQLTGGALESREVESKDWYAWHDHTLPPLRFLNAQGWIYVANPGVEPVLVLAEPQGINDRIVLLDLLLKQEPGFWAQVFVWKQAKLHAVWMNEVDQVVVRHAGKELAVIEVSKLMIEK